VGKEDEGAGERHGKVGAEGRPSIVIRLVISFNLNRQHEMEQRDHWRFSRNQQLLSSLRESIVDKPPYISGTLQLPDSCFSLFYKIAKDSSAARFARDSLTSQQRLLYADNLCRRYINLVNATPDDLEQLTQSCEPASFGVKKENVLDETYRKAGKMDSECFSSMLDPFNTDLIKIVRGYLLEGPKSNRAIKAELYKLNIYSMFLIFRVVRPYLVLCLFPRQRLILQASRRHSTKR
jgi:hypothetical protein